MENKNYRILVLSDLRKTTGTILKNTANLAKMIGGDISLLHVKKPLGVVKQDNQLSAVRSINDTYTTTKKQIEQLVKPLKKDFGVTIDTTFKVGNVKEEINRQIQELQPDIIVLGQRKSVPIKLLGDGITKHVMSTFDGLVMIASHEQLMSNSNELSIGVMNGTKETVGLDLVEKLIKQSSRPLKSFKIANRESQADTETQGDRSTVEFVFEPQDSAINNVATYLSRTNVDLLYLDLEGASQAKINVKNVIGKFNVPFLLAGKRKVDYSNNLN
ncbi:universal stress protein [Flagellimonas sp.]|uniref:universal stress protein n=1 Tax=Flagellimonas sp. TaxID=2058762 RepID=UPI003BAF7E4A